ncbi:hypothetical protein TL16_g00441 [Triparma laevis f. inornata]|uniref:Palmitoyltransferase n=1 Tax=Triparma laevis f. inornata TaxID=1714386 RepID=A0A9W6ZDJ0_9STRA|nr:hypothetical protein TL16_g00441 [Triparma laevis f. inornata]
MPRSSLSISGVPYLGTDFNCKQWLVLSPSGFTTAMLTLFLHVWSWHVSLTQFLHPALWGYNNDKTASPTTPPPISVFFRYYFMITSTILCTLSVYSHLTCMLTNPGCVPKHSRPLAPDQQIQFPYNPSIPSKVGQEEAMKRMHSSYCQKCGDNFKPPRCHHSSITGRCITKLDHFCPWVNNAIGLYNHKLFLLFVLYTNFQSLSTFIIGIITVFRCGKKVKGTWKPNSDGETWGQTYGCSKYGWEGVVVIFVGIVFFMFTSCMLGEGWEAIVGNRSKIQRLKEERGGGGESEGELRGSDDRKELALRSE